jgi:hypothetical protein
MIKAKQVNVTFTCPDKGTDERVRVDCYELEIGTGWYDQWDSYQRISFYARCSCGKQHDVTIKGG